MIKRRPSRKSRVKAPPPAKLPHISLDRQLDVLGIVLVALAGITLLSFLSATRGSLTESWIDFLSRIFGLGVYLVPFGMGLAGLWLLLRDFEQRPAIGGERTIGAVLLYLTSLALLHILTFSNDPLSLADAGGGGGYLGYYISQGLLTNLGGWGTGVAVLAALIIATILLANLSVAELSVLLQIIGQLLHKLFPFRLPRLHRSKQQRAEQLPLPSTRPMPSPAHGFPQILPAAVPDRAKIRITGIQHDWELPHINSILEEAEDQPISWREIRRRTKIIEGTLQEFGVPVTAMDANPGPVVTQFCVKPGFVEGRGGRKIKVKVSKIVALADDLALALAASPVRVEAPVPGRPFVGIEVPNANISLVSLRGAMESDTFRKIESPLRIALGSNVSGHTVSADLANMPHMLIAGATGSGKSVCINAIISCLLMNNSPADMRLIMIDPKRVELIGYNGIPHLFTPVIVDLNQVVAVLELVTNEMDKRYQEFARVGARNIKDYNKLAQNPAERLPYIVLFVDELADLMMTAPEDTERNITRLAQMARATGIHLVIATQRPSVNVVTGLIKANFPSRIAFAVTSSVDSRVILDTPGAERLLGRGDMLYMASDSSELRRLQGCFISDQEIAKLVEYWKMAGPAPAAVTFPIPSPTPLPTPPHQVVQQPLWEDMRRQKEQAAQSDDLLEQAIALVRQHNRASVSLLQRKLRIGYARAGRLIDMMEKNGIVGPSEGPGRSRRVMGPEERSSLN